jgi:hypothetical protein
MTIKTKFKPGQFVYFLENNAVLYREIYKVTVISTNLETVIKYHFAKGEPLFEHMVFGEKEDLLKSL